MIQVLGGQHGLSNVGMAEENISWEQRGLVLHARDLQAVLAVPRTLWQMLLLQLEVVPSVLPGD